MKVAIQTNVWGHVAGAAPGVTSVKDLYYEAGEVSDAMLAEIRAARYAGIEVFDGDLLRYQDDLDGFRQRLSDHGQTLVGVYSGANFVYPDILDDELHRIRHAASLAARAGAEQLVVGGGGVRASGATDEDYVRLARGLDAVAEIAEAEGLTPTFHPHLGTIAQAPDQIERVFGRSRIGFCPDMAHLAAAGGDPAALVRRYADRMPYVHLKDYRPDPFEFLPLGAGTLDMDGILAALKEVGYDDWIVVEIDGYSGDPKEGAQTSRAYLDAHW